MARVLDVRSILRRHREERAGDVFSLARRLAANESVAPEAILETMAAAGASDDDLSDAVDLVCRRDELRRTAADGPAARAEVEALRGAIAKHRAELTAAEERYRRAVEPLAAKEADAIKRETAASQAEAALLSPANLPKPLHDQIEEARRAYHAAETAVAELKSLISRQEERARNAREELDAYHGGADKALAAYEDQDRRRVMAADRVDLVLNVRGGTHQVAAAKPKVADLMAKRDAAKIAFDTAKKTAREF